MKKTLFHSTVASRVGRISRLGLAVAASAWLAACGDGGGSIWLDRAGLQGRWISTSPSYIAIVVPSADSNSTSDAWALRWDVQALAKLSIESNGASSGTLFSFTEPVTAAPISGGVDLNQAVSPKTLTLPGLAAGGTAFNQVDNLAGTATLADAAGTWAGQVSGGTKTVSWTIDGSTGTIAGSSSTGCSYNGSLAPMSAAKVYSAVFSESCPGGSGAGYTGVATLKSDQTTLTTVAVANDRSRAIAFVLTPSAN